VSRTSARHRKPSRSSPADPGPATQQRRSAPRRRARRHGPARIALAAVAASALLAYGWFAATNWKTLTGHPSGLSQADDLGGLPGAGPRATGSGATASPGAAVNQAEIVGTAVVSRGRHPGLRAVALDGYMNPLRAVSALVPERIDEGVDFTGSGPVYALGDAVVTNAGYNGGWPGGGWITYRLTNGPDAGLMVYLAEDVTATVQVGQHVTPATVVGNMFEGGDGIETGWAEPTGDTAESQLPQAGGIGGYGPYPTEVGLNFDQLLHSLGVPAAPNSGQAAYGILPSNYPNIWG
jgi:murein DD-endopeptidase MepM/ murein hydrolase activator NlpD